LTTINPITRLTASTYTSNIRQIHRYDDMSLVNIKKIVYVSFAPLFPTHTTRTLYYTARSSKWRDSRVEICVSANTISSLRLRYVAILK